MICLAERSRGGEKMKKTVALGTVISLGGGAVCLFLQRSFPSDVLFSLEVTFFTTFFHFAMRFLTACAVTAFRKNRTYADSHFIRLCRAERMLYKKIRVGRWKKYAPTYKPQLFSLRENSYAELLHHMTDALIGHMIMVVLSYAPIMLSGMLGGRMAFLLTSAAASVFDMQFVIIQRYNRERVWRILKKQTSAD